MSVKEYYRNTGALALLIALPIVFIGVTSNITKDVSLPVEIYSATPTIKLTVSSFDYEATINALAVSAFLGGITGLFFAASSKQADRRLVLAGYGAHEVVGGRLLALVTTVVIVTLTASLMTFYYFVPQSPLLLIAAVFLVTLIYAGLGVIVGMIVNTLEGSYVLIILTLIDIAYANNQLVSSHYAQGFVFPAYLAVRLGEIASFTTSLGLSFLLGSVALLAAVWCLAILAFNVVTRPR